MSRFKCQVLAGVCTLAGAAALAASAQAQTIIHGGGSTLAAPYWGQATKCYDSANTSYYLSGTIEPFAPKVSTMMAGSTSGLCTPVTSGVNIIQFDAAGSGVGVAGVFAHDAYPGAPFDGAGLLTSASTIGFGSTDTEGAAVAEVFPSIQYGLSDIPLANPDVGVYAVGDSASYTPPDGSGAFTTAASYEGLTFSGGAAHVVGSTAYPVAQPLYGPLVQFPVSIDPVAVPYNTSYVSISNGVTYPLQVNATNGLRLDNQAICKIFSGQITDWGDSYLATLNAGSLLNASDPNQTSTGHPIILVGRSDVAGDTLIFTRHLAAVCGGLAPGFGSSGQREITAEPTAISSLYILAQGSKGVADFIDNNPGTIGYVGVSYVAPYSAQTGATPGYTLTAANLKNASGNWEAPTFTTAEAAFSSINPPTGASRSDATQWVEGAASSVPLANPSAAGAYPIVGTTNFVAPACYASAASVAEIRGFLRSASVTSSAVLHNAGLGLLNTTWLNAIDLVFIDPNNTILANLGAFFAQAGTGSNGGSFTNARCTVSGVVGG